MDSDRNETTAASIFNSQTVKLWVDATCKEDKQLNVDENCIQLLSEDVSYRLREILNVWYEGRQPFPKPDE